MPIAIAAKKDVPALVSLINSAYRGQESTKGWTTEAHLLTGELRTDQAGLSKLFEDSNTTFVKFTNDQGIITGCVYLHLESRRLYLGMLAVSPTAQGQGIGKKLLQASEKHAKKLSCRSVHMTVISVRHELIKWYIRHGYRPTGDTEPFPVDHRFGVPTQPLAFIVMEKIILQQT